MTAASSDDIAVRRMFDASPESVFDAWLDPVKMQQWMCDGDAGWRFVLDPREGGTFHIEMMYKGDRVPHDGVYRVIQRPNRLEFTWKSPYTNNLDTAVSIELTAAGDATEVVLTHEGLPEQWREAHRGGWGEFLDQLGAWLE